MQKISTILDKLKYFGLRFLYYRLIKRIFPDINYYLLDILRPILVSKYLTRKIIEEYWGFIGHWAKTKPPFLGLGLIHYGLIRNRRPKRILCFGSYRGFMPIIRALACRDNKKGKVDFVDAGLDFSKKDPLLGDGFWKKVEFYNHFSKLIDQRYIKTYVVLARKFAKKYPKRQFEYIYIETVTMPLKE